MNSKIVLVNIKTKVKGHFQSLNPYYFIGTFKNSEDENHLFSIMSIHHQTNLDLVLLINHF